MNPHISMIFLHTTDLPRLRAFYRDTLGLEEKWREEGQSAWFDCGSVMLVLHVPEDGLGPPPFDPAKGGVLLWFELDGGIEERYRALLDAGVTMAVPLRQWPVRSIFCVQDPEGRRIGFFQSNSDPATPPDQE